MRIAYVTHTRFPTEKAHGYQVAQVCHALASLGHSVTLITPTVGSVPVHAAFKFYGIPESFSLQRLQQFDALSAWWVPGKFAFLIAMLSYRRALRRYFREHAADILYVRSPVLLSALYTTKIPVILELHTLPRFFHRRFIRLISKCRMVVCLTRAMRDQLIAWGMDPRRILVEGDGVDHERFYHLPGTSLAKQDWRLPSDHTIVGYVGSLVTRDVLEKGVGELIDAVSLLRSRGENIFCWIVGGPNSWTKTYKRRAESLGLTAKDIRFEGAIPVRSVPSAMAACDVCVYPAPKTTHPFFLRDTSPLKLFEYLAARKPIVCADLPPVRDIVDATIVHFCTPGDAESLADAIIQAMRNPIRHPHRRAEIVDHHSWAKRMGRIMAECE